MIINKEKEREENGIYANKKKSVINDCALCILRVLVWARVRARALVVAVCECFCYGFAVAEYISHQMRSRVLLNQMFRILFLSQPAKLRLSL